MAINFIQQPFLSTINKRIHSAYYPAMYTALSTLYASSGFSYNFKIYTVDGLLASDIVSPTYVNGIGEYNPNVYVKNELAVKFQPNVVNYAKCEGFAKQYRVDVAEYGITSPQTYTGFKVWAANLFDEEFAYETFQLDGTTKKFLTEIESDRVVTRQDRGTLRFFNGTLINQAYTANISRVYEIVLVKTTSNGTKKWYKFRKNPYYANTTSVGLAVPNATLQSLDEYILDIPAYPWNITNSTGWSYFAYQNVGGAYTQLPIPSIATNIISDAVEYDIYSYCWPYGTNGYTSAPVTFRIAGQNNLECTVSNNSGLDFQFAWSNKYGGFDYFSQIRSKEKSISTNKYTYTAPKYQQGQIAGTYNGNYNYVGYNELTRGKTVYGGNSTTNWMVETDYLKNQQFEELEYLYKSRNVFVRIEDKWYPAVVTDTNMIPVTDALGLRSLRINFEIANKEVI